MRIRLAALIAAALIAGISIGLTIVATTNDNPITDTHNITVEELCDEIRNQNIDLARADTQTERDAIFNNDLTERIEAFFLNEDNEGQPVPGGCYEAIARRQDFQD